MLLESCVHSRAVHLDMYECVFPRADDGRARLAALKSQSTPVARRADDCAIRSTIVTRRRIGRRHGRRQTSAVRAIYRAIIYKNKKINPPTVRSRLRAGIVLLPLAPNDAVGATGSPHCT